MGFAKKLQTMYARVLRRIAGECNYRKRNEQMCNDDGTYPDPPWTAFCCEHARAICASLCCAVLEFSLHYYTKEPKTKPCP
eukprot:8055815-Lingulodinium_polyedra.AAC.1